uniref:Exo-alpha-sialidase n=1 Tax=Prevotella sp. GTC17254 TaxID=3236794 RepID=A0AB33J0U7_9BACT
MKGKLLSTAVLLLSAISLLSSCLGNNDENTTYYGETAITSFKLGTLKRTIHTKTASGKDSVYTATLEGSNYPFYIDQINHRIYNPDSLPKGVDVRRVACTIAAKSGGVILLKDNDSDSLFYYNTADSIDFRQPREFRVMSAVNNSETAMRSYTIQVNVHKEVADTFVWKNPAINNAQIAALTAMRGYALGGFVYVVGNKGAGVEVYRTAESDGATWSAVVPNVALAVEAYKNIAVQGNTAYLLNGGTIYTSTDFKTWVKGASATTIKQLLGFGTKKLYAVTVAGGLAASADNGATWTDEKLDNEPTLLPTEDVNFICKRGTASDPIDYLTIIGSRSDAYATDSTAMVWGKVEELSADAKTSSWAYYPIARGDKYKAPRLQGLQAVQYGNGIRAIGGAGRGAGKQKAFANVFTSVDGGLHWPKDATIAMPTGFSSSETSFALVVDSQNRLWIICGGTGQVWKGLLSDLAWKKEEKIFQ